MTSNRGNLGDTREDGSAAGHDAPDEAQSTDDTIEALKDAREVLVREDSDELLSAIERLRRIEAEKRETPFSSPAFHERARRVEDEARRVFRRAAREEAHGEHEPERRVVDGIEGPGWPGGTSPEAEDGDVEG